MAYVGQRPSVKSVHYTPQSTLPTNPVEGQVYYSDGTISVEGLYVYKNAAWELITTGGVPSYSVVTKTTTYTATTADDVILADTSGGAFTLTLYSASGNTGQQIIIKKISSDTDILTIDADGTETIDGNLSYLIPIQYDSVILISDGTNWVISSSENKLVAARYNTNAGLSIPNNTEVDVIYEDLIADTHNAYNTITGLYTIPVSGWYDIKALATFTNNNLDAGSSYYIGIEVNGTLIKRDQNEANATNVSDNDSAAVQDTYPLNRGDVIGIIIFQNGGSTESLSTVSTRNTFSIHRIK